MLLSPTSTQYLVGAPDLRSQWHCASHGRKNKQKAPINRCFNFILGSLKSQNFDVWLFLKRREFDGFLMFLSGFWKSQCTRRTLRFWNHVIASDNAHSFARVRLFPTGTQYPAGSPVCALEWHSASHGMKYQFCNVKLTRESRERP